MAYYRPRRSQTEEVIYGFFGLIISCVIIFLIGSSVYSWLRPPKKVDRGTTCIDVTSYDNDWSNDMKCTKPDGTVFYTDYSGAEKYQ